MTSQSMFVGLIEVAPLEGSELDPDEVAGAMVRCYIAAESSNAAMQMLTESLEEIACELIGVEWFVDNALVEWENPDDDAGEALIRQAGESGEVVYSDFHVWGHDEVAE